MNIGSKKTLEMDLKWHKIGLRNKIEENINNCIEKDLPLQSVEPIRSIKKEQVNKIINLFQIPPSDEKRILAEEAYRELSHIFCEYLMKDKTEICVRNRAICCFSSKAMNQDKNIGIHIAKYQFASYMEKFQTIVKWGATVNYHPEHVKVLEEKKLLQTKTLYVTNEIADFLNVCMKKINQKFIDVKSKIFKEESTKSVIQEKELLEFIKVDQNEDEFYKTNLKYRTISIFFIDEVRERVIQESQLYVHLFENKQSESIKKIKGFVSNFDFSYRADTHLQKNHDRNDQPFMSQVVRKVLFKLCTPQSKESGTKNHQWNLLDEYDKALSN